MCLTLRRWYVAWHPGSEEAILRAKDDAGIAEWRAREWRQFPAAPLIVDVTASMGALLARIAVPPGTGGSAQATPVLTIRDDGAAVELRAAAGPAADGEVADVSSDLRQMVALDVMGGLRQVTGTARRWPFPLDGREFAAARPFGAGTRLCRIAAGGHNGGGGHPVDRPFPVHLIGQRLGFPKQLGPVMVAPASDVEPGDLWGLDHGRGPAIDWPPLWAAEGATEAGQRVRVEQR